MTARKPTGRSQNQRLPPAPKTARDSATARPMMNSAAAAFGAGMTPDRRPKSTRSGRRSQSSGPTRTLPGAEKSIEADRSGQDDRGHGHRDHRARLMTSRPYPETEDQESATQPIGPDNHGPPRHIGVEVASRHRERQGKRCLQDERREEDRFAPHDGQHVAASFQQEADCKAAGQEHEDDDFRTDVAVEHQPFGEGRDGDQDQEPRRRPEPSDGNESSGPSDQRQPGRVQATEREIRREQADFHESMATEDARSQSDWIRGLPQLACARSWR